MARVGGFGMVVAEVDRHDACMASQGEQIAARRHALGWSRRRLALAAQVSQRSVFAAEKDASEHARTVAPILAALEAAENELRGPEGEMPGRLRAELARGSYIEARTVRRKDSRTRYLVVALSDGPLSDDELLEALDELDEQVAKMAGQG